MEPVKKNFSIPLCRKLRIILRVLYCVTSRCTPSMDDLDAGLAVDPAKQRNAAAFCAQIDGDTRSFLHGSGETPVSLEPVIHFRAERRCGRKSGQTRRSPKAVAGPQSRMTTQDGPTCAATRGAGANFPHFIVARRSKILHIRPSSLLELRKIGSQRRP